MKLKLEKRSIILLSTITALFILSVMLFFLAGNNLDRRILFFPGKGNYSGEIRHVPRQKSREDNIEVFVKELILGPYSIDHYRIIPQKTKLQNLLLRNKSKLYIDFSADFIVSEEDLAIIPSEMIALIRKNLVYNFPFLKDVSISVDGQRLQ